jgi:hypothetical protein
MNFVSCDWGTTNFRLRLVGGPAAAEVRTDDGAAKLAALGGDRAAVFRDTLFRGLTQLGAPEDWPVVVSGMASSTIGWRELPYARLPFALDGGDAVWERVAGRVILVSGFRGDSDMLRGEETQALGLAAALGAELPATATLVLSPTPRITRNKGNKAEAGVERKKSITNSSERYTRTDEPSTSPSGTQIRVAIRKASKVLTTVTRRSAIRLPLTKPVQIACAESCGEGSRTGSISLS